MKEESTFKEQKVSIIDLYPELTQEQQELAAYYLGRYLEVVRGIFERTSNLKE
jgi:RIO-like serine/threonine protein kinase